MTEEELSHQIKQYQNLAGADKKIDIASLALAALKTGQENLLTAKEKRIAYFVSIGVPPFGLLYAIKFYTSGKSDGKQAAYICLGLTAASIILLLVMVSGLFASSGLTPQQLQDAPKQYQELLQ